MSETLGRVIAVAGSQMTVGLEEAGADEAATRIGAMVKVRCADLDVVGTIGGLQSDGNGCGSRSALVVDLLGEIVYSSEGRFHRGVSHHPVGNAPVLAASETDLRVIYAQPSVSNVSIGTLYHDPARHAFVLIDELLAKNFAVLGMTGSGKSCAVTLILSAILADHPNAHIVVLDPHNEYCAAFGELAEIVNVDNLHLPFWLLDFEEAVEVLVRGGTTQEQEAQANILREAIIRARRRSGGASWITADTPMPFAIPDLIRLIDEAMGKLDKPDTSVPYQRLRSRLETLQYDPRYAFMFSDRQVTRDTLSQIIGRLLRIPVSGKPLTILDLSGIPSEIADAVVSLCCRLTFDFALWAERERRPPVLLVCEEAHRYVPAAEGIGFAATTRAISRIAREGRKYGISLALITQLPSELSPVVLSQCGTIFALRLGYHLDHHFVATALPDAARGMLAALPSMRTQEGIAFGEGVPLPMRIRFHDLPPEQRPRSASAEFSKAWQTDATDTDFLDESIRRWRYQSRSS
jgi:DNA helicase HerA-like ATPase